MPAPAPAAPSPFWQRSWFAALVVTTLFIGAPLASYLVKWLAVDSRAYEIVIEVDGPSPADVYYRIDDHSVDRGVIELPWKKTIQHEGTLGGVRLYAPEATSCRTRINGKVCTRSCDWGSCYLDTRTGKLR